MYTYNKWLFLIKKIYISCQFAQQKGTLTVQKSGLHLDYGKVTENFQRDSELKTLKISHICHNCKFYFYTNG